MASFRFRTTDLDSTPFRGLVHTHLANVNLPYLAQLISYGYYYYYYQFQDLMLYGFDGSQGFVKWLSLE